MGTLGLLLSATVVLAPRYLWIARWAEAVQFINAAAGGGDEGGGVSAEVLVRGARRGPHDFVTVEAFVGGRWYIKTESLTRLRVDWR